MTDRRPPGHGAVPWLTAQSVVFGVMAALLGIVANAIFLDAYGSGWLPATYIAIGAAGVVVSGAVARAARAAELVPIALVVLGGAALGIGASWVVAVGGDGAWVSIPLLVLFPILIQLGFVFVGGQGGRLLDIEGIKRFFPRIFAGFPVGAVLGGLLGGWLVTWTGRVEDLLLATAAAQGGFAALVWATGRRFAGALRLGDAGGGDRSTEPPAPEGEPAFPSWRRLLTAPFVLLILVYQVFSAVASQLADFLVYDRAVAQYPDPADLARYLSAYTAVMNIASIGFLILVAGPLLRRLGLRFGIAANPVGLTILGVATVATFAVAGGASLALLLVVSTARIADIALTDGTTRTSINAIYQVLPERTRLPVQTAVEGIGVPVAIGISGVLILGLTALPDALAATIAVTLAVCVVWTWSAILLYRAYGPALVDALRRRRWLEDDAELALSAADEDLARRLVTGPDPRAARLGFELLAASARPGLVADLGALATSPNPDVRLGALAGLADAGDGVARARLANEVRAASHSTDAGDRVRAAAALSSLDGAERAAAADLLADPDPRVRAAALGSVRAGDDVAVAAVLAGLRDPATLGAAAGAAGRLGDAIVPALAAALDGAGSPAPVEVGRLVRATAVPSPARDDVLRRHLAHADPELGLTVIERLVGPAPATDAVAAALDAAAALDVRHAVWVLTARVALEDVDEPLRRALDDELDLIRRRILAGRLARHGSDLVGPPTTELASDGPGAALAAEALGVLLGRDAAPLLALLEPGRTPAERLARLTRIPDGPDVPGGPDSWLRDLVEDPAERWRSPWLRACAIRAARLRGAAGSLDLGPARAVRDPVIDEEIALVG